MVRPAILRGSMALPRERVSVADMRKACTIEYLPMGEPEPFELLAYREDDSYIYVPRQLGLRICLREGIEYLDQTSPGTKAKFPRAPEPRDYQIDALAEVQACMQDYYDFLFRARTGWGKTYGSLIIAARTGVSTLVIVDQENLKDQWIKSLKDGFGFKDEEIGLIQGKTLRFKGCAVTIAMVHTLSQKRMPQEVYDYFGLMIVDETHTIGAPTFSSVLMDFSAGYRFGVSATPKRKDGLQKVLDYNLGKVRVYIDDEHAENSVYVAEHGSVYSWYANTSPKTGRFITEISEDASRNLLVAESAAYLYETGRDVLVLSDRIEHLKHLMSLCVYLGMPQEDMGLYAGYNPIFRYAKEATPQRRPYGYVVHDGEGKALYTPISLQLIAKRFRKDTLAATKDSARVIFATFGMFSKGVDVPRLTGGIDASPRSRAEQIHGRILRGLEGALRSIWITIADYNSYRSLHGVAERITEYVRNNARIYRWSLEEGEFECSAKALKAEYREEVKNLKSSRIETNSDGLLTLVAPSSRVAHAMQAVSDIKERIQKRLPASPTVSIPAASSARLLVRTSKPPSSASASPFLKRRRPSVEVSLPSVAGSPQTRFRSPTLLRRRRG